MTTLWARGWHGVDGGAGSGTCGVDGIMGLGRMTMLWAQGRCGVESIMASGRTMVLWAREWRGVDCIACFGMVHAVLMASLPRGQGRW
jgi:hypothetical protein